MRRGRPSLLGTMARTAVIAGTATAVSGAVAGGQQQRAAAAQQQAAQQQAATGTQQQVAEMQQQMAALQAQQAQATIAAQSQPGATGEDVLAQITQLAQLNASGTLTDQQFAEAARAKLLAG